jgi:transcriptional regulator
LSTKSDQLEWRRSKVVEMRARGLSYQEIARELQVSKASIVSDVQYLREQAKGTIKEYTTEYLPEQYQLCLTALDEIIKRAFEIL